MVLEASRVPEATTTIDAASEEDDTLVLLFMFTLHRALSSAIALTLRAVGGLTTAEIAKAFLVPEPTMAQRISRAKQKTSRTPALPPTADDQEEPAQRLRAVLHVLYLVLQWRLYEQRRSAVAAAGTIAVRQFG